MIYDKGNNTKKMGSHHMDNSLTSIIDFLHAHFCYQYFITPINLPIPKEYRSYADRACLLLERQRNELIHIVNPRHHVIHHFSQPFIPSAKKILIAHGWMSRSAYMVGLINALHRQGFDVYALDFPAHGEAKGMQLTWSDAVTILRRTINHFGPFYAVIGHSFGGSMLLNTLNLAHQFADWNLSSIPERVVLMASPTRMRTPVNQLARQLKLSAKGYLLLRNFFRDKSPVDLKQLAFSQYIKQAKTPFLCVHGKDDSFILPKESIIFCEKYPHATLSLIPHVDHISILMDTRVEKIVTNFLLA
jgi:pimeloyl-ACP methyl ester carboxylesterase